MIKELSLEYIRKFNKTTSASPVFLNEQTLLKRKLSIENTKRAMKMQKRPYNYSSEESWITKLREKGNNIIELHFHSVTCWPHECGDYATFTNISCWCRMLADEPDKSM